MTALDDWLLHDRPSEFDVAVCRGVDPSVFYPQRLTNVSTPVREVCRACPAREACILAAVEAGEMFGIWGGLASMALRRLRLDGYVESNGEEVMYDPDAGEVLIVGATSEHATPREARAALRDLEATVHDRKRPARNDRTDTSRESDWCEADHEEEHDATGTDRGRPGSAGGRDGSGGADRRLRMRREAGAGRAVASGDRTGPDDGHVGGARRVVARQLTDRRAARIDRSEGDPAAATAGGREVPADRRGTDREALAASAGRGRERAADTDARRAS